MTSLTNSRSATSVMAGPRRSSCPRTASRSWCCIGVNPIEAASCSLQRTRALGVGYDVIEAQIGGRITIAGLLSILVVKLVIWAVALGSGTSGGILASILIMGAAIGGLVGSILPGGSAGAWSLLGMGAVLATMTRAPLTAVVFGLELTFDVELLLPLLLACTVGHLVSVLVLPRSILTEKVARRGFHVVREYSVGPLEALFVRDVMATDVLTAGPDVAVAEVYGVLESASMRRQRLLPVVERDGERRLRGMLTSFDLLAARERNLQEERHRERVSRLRGVPRLRPPRPRAAGSKVEAGRIER